MINTENEINKYSFWDIENIYILHFSLSCRYESVKHYNPVHFLVFFTFSVHYLITFYVCIWFIAFEICPVWGLKFIYNCSYLMLLLAVCVLVHTWNNTAILNICVCSFRVNIKKYYLLSSIF